MSPSLRFLALATAGWIGVRMITVGHLPNPDFFKFRPTEAKAAEITPTQFAEIEPIAPAQPIAVEPQPAPVEATVAAAAPAIRYVQGMVGVPVAMTRGVVPVYQLPAAMPARPGRPARYYDARSAGVEGYAQLPEVDGWPATRLAGLSLPGSFVSTPQSMPAAPVPPIDPHKLDRLQLSSWALLRNQQTGTAGSRSLASGGQLGASQGGVRLIYNIDRRIGVAARFSSEVGRRGGEAALGIRVRPLVSVPVWITAERRQAVGKYGGGRSDFALFMEGGLYQQPLPWDFALDGYLQGGVVGLKTRDLFIDGAVTVSRPVYRQFSAGFGIWGGAQPGLYRVDAGPRITMRVRNNLKVHVDRRQKLTGNARPGSGPVLTLAGDF